MKCKLTILLFFFSINLLSFIATKETLTQTFDLILNGARPTLTIKSGNMVKIRLVSLKSDYTYELKDVKHLITKKLIPKPAKLTKLKNDLTTNFVQDPKGSDRGYYEFVFHPKVKGRHGIVFAFKKKGDTIPEKLFPVVLNLV
jgi:hypothetical protein